MDDNNVDFGSVIDGCEFVINVVELVGKIVLVDCGFCNFIVKVLYV